VNSAPFINSNYRYYLATYHDHSSGTGENITYETANNNTHGTPNTGSDNRYDPTYCDTYSCTGSFAHSYDQAWTVQIVHTITTVGTDSSSGSLTPATTTYAYDMSAWSTAQPCPADSTGLTTCTGYTWYPKGELNTYAGNNSTNTSCFSDASYTAYIPCEVVLTQSRTTNYEQTGATNPNAPWVQQDNTYDDYNTTASFGTLGGYHNLQQQVRHVETVQRVAIEMIRPGPKAHYGALGAVFVPDDTQQLCVEVSVSNDQGDIVADSLAGRIETVRKGFLEEYVIGFLDGMMQYEPLQTLGGGTLSFRYALHGEIGSSIWFFQVIGRVIINLLTHQLSSLSDEDLKEIIQSSMRS
jgi:hypothetical protein